MRIGVFGGTFDPVHYGHLLLAEQCREQCALDEIWLTPAGIPPHKDARGISPGNARADMLELAVAGHEQFRVDRRELGRKGPSFTVQTLEDLRGEDPTRELFFLVGGDSLTDLPNWYQPRRISELATLVVVNRGGIKSADLTALVPALGEAAIARIWPVAVPGIELSSSDIRRRVQNGRSIRFMTPRAVECYIATHGLYKAIG